MLNTLILIGLNNSLFLEASQQISDWIRLSYI